VHLLWAFGEDDTIDYHFKNRGSFQVHLLQPDLAPQIPPPNSKSSAPNMTGFDVWRLSVSLSSSNTTSSNSPWCVFQKGPELEKKNYIIGVCTRNLMFLYWFLKAEIYKMVVWNVAWLIICMFWFKFFQFSTLMNSEEIKIYLDRLVIYKCFPKSQNTEDTKFKELVDYSGKCENATDLYSYCKDIIYTYGRGGKVWSVD